MSYKTVLFERDGSVATITLNRPEAMNSLDEQLLEDVAAALAACENDGAIRSVILTATGRAFCAGADVRMLASRRGEEVSASFLYRFADVLHERVVMPIRRMAKPVLAAVNGVAAGAGLGLVACCDLRIAASDARFTVAYSNIAFCPDGSTTFFLPRLVGLAKTMELYLSNDMLSAEQAQQLGLVSRVVETAALPAVAKETAQRLASGPSFAYGQTKQLLNRSFENDLAAQMRDEARAVALCAGTDDHRSGLEAFLAKQRPRFVGH